MHLVLQHEGVRGAGVEPDVENIVDLFPGIVGELAQQALARARLVPGVGALRLEGLDDADFDLGVLQNLDRAVRLLLDEHGNGHAPGALARDHPVGALLDHAGDAVLACGRHPTGDGDRLQRAGAQRIAALRDVFIHRDEPLRRIAKDDRLLRTPRVWILMLQAATRDDHMRIDQRLDHRLVGVALFALVVDDALTLKPRRLCGESTIFVHRVGNGRINIARFEGRLLAHPNFKVVAAVARRRVYKPRTVFIGNVITIKKRHDEFVTSAAERMLQCHVIQHFRWNVSPLFESCHFRLLKDFSGKLFCQDKQVSSLRPVLCRCFGHPIKCVIDP